jgi:hypothetical protein
MHKLLVPALFLLTGCDGRLGAKDGDDDPLQPGSDCRRSTETTLGFVGASYSSYGRVEDGPFAWKPLGASIATSVDTHGFKERSNGVAEDEARCDELSALLRNSLMYSGNYVASMKYSRPRIVFRTALWLRFFVKVIRCLCKPKTSKKSL